MSVYRKIKRNVKRGERRDLTDAQAEVMALRRVHYRIIRKERGR